MSQAIMEQSPSIGKEGATPVVPQVILGLSETAFIVPIDDPTVPPNRDYSFRLAAELTSQIDPLSLTVEHREAGHVVIVDKGLPSSVISTIWHYARKGGPISREVPSYARLGQKEFASTLEKAVQRLGNVVVANQAQVA